MSDHITLAYVAGIVDGEGSICLNRRPSPGRRSLYRVPILVVAMTAFPIIQYLYDNFGGWMAQRNRTRGLAGHADIWEWKLTGERALTLMAELRPFMREPRKTARIDFVLSDAFRTQQGDRSYGSDAKEARRESIYSQFHAL